MTSASGFYVLPSSSILASHLESCKQEIHSHLTQGWAWLQQQWQEIVEWRPGLQGTALPSASAPTFTEPSGKCDALLLGNAGCALKPALGAGGGTRAVWVESDAQRC